jgi:hypothetical protein
MMRAAAFAGLKCGGGGEKRADLVEVFDPGAALDAR